MQTRPAHRLFSVIFAALMTFGMLGAVDHLAQPDAESAQMAQMAQMLKGAQPSRA